MPFISEALVEEALLAQLEGLGITTLHDSAAGPDASEGTATVENEVQATAEVMV